METLLRVPDSIIWWIVAIPVFCLVLCFWSWIFMCIMSGLRKMVVGLLKLVAWFLRQGGALWEEAMG